DLSERGTSTLRGDDAARNSAERGEGGQVPCQFEERARRHTSRGRRPGGGGASHQSVTKQSRRSQSRRCHTRSRGCCGGAPLALGDRGTATTVDRSLGSSSTLTLFNEVAVLH